MIDLLRHRRFCISRLSACLYGLFYFGLLYGAPAAAQSVNLPGLDSLLTALDAGKKGMGSMAIAKGGTLLYSRATGYSFISDSLKVRATTATRYRIASITKMFTAVMIFQLMEEGSLSLQTTLDKFFPNFPAAAHLTVAQLLGHRSGLSNFTDVSNYKDWKGKPKSRAEMLDLIASAAPAFEPGRKAAYSNSNYLLLGYIIEDLTGLPYKQALQRRINDKIGLSATYYGDSTDIAAGESFSYRMAGDWVQEPVTDLSIPGGAGALLSTPSDLCLFISALFTGRLVSDSSLKIMQTMRDEFGMGLLPFKFKGRAAFGHNGSIDGFSSVVFYLPDDSVAIAYCANGLVYPRNDIVLTALRIYYGLPFETPSFKTITVAASELDAYLGTYSCRQLKVKVTITKDKATLFGQATGQTPFPLEATAKDRFAFFTSGIDLQFRPELNEMIFSQHGEKYLFTKDK